MSRNVSKAALQMAAIHFFNEVNFNRSIDAGLHIVTCQEKEKNLPSSAVFIHQCTQVGFIHCSPNSCTLVSDWGTLSSPWKATVFHSERLLPFITLQCEQPASVQLNLGTNTQTRRGVCVCVCFSVRQSEEAFCENTLLLIWMRL